MDEKESQSSNEQVPATNQENSAPETSQPTDLNADNSSAEAVSSPAETTPTNEPTLAPTNTNDPGMTPETSVSSTGSPENAPTPAVSPVVAASDGGLHPATGNPMLSDQPPKKGLFSKTWFKITLPVAVLVIILALAYIFLWYLPHTPSAVYTSSLQRTGGALDKLIAYSETNQGSNAESWTINGTANVETGSEKFSANLHGLYDKSYNTDSQLKVDSQTTGNENTHLQGELDARTIKPSGQKTPDVYFKVDGFDSLFAMMGPSLTAYQGKWISIDHQLIDEYANATLDQQSDSKDSTPSKDQVFDAIKKVQEVNKQYIFDAEPADSVLVKKEYIGAEKKYDQNTYHYKMGYNKTNLIKFIQAEAKALNSSKLNDWSQKNFDRDIVTQSDLNASIQEIKKDVTSSDSFDMWSNKRTRLIEALKFTEEDNTKNTVTLSQAYDGGDVYPFRLDFTENENGDNISGTANLVYDSKVGKYSLDLNVSVDSNGNKTKVKAHLDATPSDKHVKPEVPKNAIPLSQLLSQLGFGGAPTGEPASIINDGQSSNSSSISL